MVDPAAPTPDADLPETLEAALFCAGSFLVIARHAGWWQQAVPTITRGATRCRDHDGGGGGPRGLGRLYRALLADAAGRRLPDPSPRRPKSELNLLLRADAGVPLAVIGEVNERFCDRCVKLLRAQQAPRR